MKVALSAKQAKHDETKKPENHRRRRRLQLLFPTRSGYSAWHMLGAVGAGAAGVALLLSLDRHGLGPRSVHAACVVNAFVKKLISWVANLDRCLALEHTALITLIKISSGMYAHGRSSLRHAHGLQSPLCCT